MLNTVEVILGLALVAVTLKDVVDTVVIPGSTLGWLRAAERLRRLTHSSWRRMSHKGEGAPRISRGFAPFLLIATFLSWIVLLLLGFTLLAHAARADYAPRIESFPEAIYAAGSAMVTIGIGQQVAFGAARWVELGAGVCGLAVITLVITYILQVQNGLHTRDAPILKLADTAGRPPSGVALLESYAQLGCIDELPYLFREWRDWSAKVLHRQATHPALTYFRSISGDMDWPAALGAVLDAATLTMAYLDEHEGQGVATLLHREGSRLTAVMTQIFKLSVDEAPATTEADVRLILHRLQAAGYRVNPDADPQRFVKLRADYLARLTAVAGHLGADGLTLIGR